jgi:hypothetical protein
MKCFGVESALAGTVGTLTFRTARLITAGFLSIAFTTRHNLTSRPASEIYPQHLLGSWIHQSLLVKLTRNKTSVVIKLRSWYYHTRSHPLLGSETRILLLSRLYFKHDDQLNSTNYMDWALLFTPRLVIASMLESGQSARQGTQSCRTWLLSHTDLIDCCIMIASPAMGHTVGHTSHLLLFWWPFRQV